MPPRMMKPPHFVIHRSLSAVGESPRDGGAHNVVGFGGNGDGCGNPCKDEKRRHEESAAHAKHA